VKELVVESVELCPEPIVGGLAAITGDVRAGFTVMMIGLDVTIADGDPVSATWSSKDQDPTAERAPVEVDVGDVQVEELPRLL
jgi:hypothetical protein